MPALPDDIFAAMRDVIPATWTSAPIAARYPSARDGSAQPSIGYFDLVGDAQIVIDARGALIGVERRRFTTAVVGLAWPTVSTGLPQSRLVDTEQGVDGVFLAARIELDLEAEKTTFEVFG